VLVYVQREADETSAQATVSLTKSRMLALLAGDRESAGIDQRGDAGVLDRLMSVLQPGDPSFDIVLP
jgi:alkyl sulfatase BDS1-like metallo-beta-lactamase superfamily hydrolase